MVATEYKRTQHTLAPLAERVGKPVEVRAAATERLRRNARSAATGVLYMVMDSMYLLAGPRRQCRRASLSRCTGRRRARHAGLRMRCNYRWKLPNVVPSRPARAISTAAAAVEAQRFGFVDPTHGPIDGQRPLVAVATSSGAAPIPGALAQPVAMATTARHGMSASAVLRRRVRAIVMPRRTRARPALCSTSPN